jgi:hypothetical protein
VTQFKDILNLGGLKKALGSSIGFRIVLKLATGQKMWRLYNSCDRQLFGRMVAVIENFAVATSCLATVLLVRIGHVLRDIRQNTPAGHFAPGLTKSQCFACRVCLAQIEGLQSECISSPRRRGKDTATGQK